MVKIMTNSSRKTNAASSSYASKRNGNLCSLANYATTTCLELIKIMNSRLIWIRMPKPERNSPHVGALWQDHKTSTELTLCSTAVNYLTFHSNFGSQIHVFVEGYRLIIKNQPDQQHFNLQHLYKEGKELLHLPAMDLLCQAGGLVCDFR
jgi:hypothetical protein